MRLGTASAGIGLGSRAMLLPAGCRQKLRRSATLVSGCTGTAMVTTQHVEAAAGAQGNVGGRAEPLELPSAVLPWPTSWAAEHTQRHL